MADVVDVATRSRMMSGIRGKDTKPEMVVRRYLHQSGFRYRLHVRDLPGRPDIVLPKFNAVVDVRGCFWHQHAGCRYAATPKSNRSFWQDKLASNVRRDRTSEEALSALGWRVFVVWECEIREQRSLAPLARAIRRGKR